MPCASIPIEILDYGIAVRSNYVKEALLRLDAYPDLYVSYRAAKSLLAAQNDLISNLESQVSNNDALILSLNLRAREVEFATRQRLLKERLTFLGIGAGAALVVVGVIYAIVPKGK